MPYHLILDEGDQEATRAVGENVFLTHLPVNYPVYAFYYPAEMPDQDFEQLLRHLGQRTGDNFFINIGRLDDPQFNKIAAAFEIRSLPAIALTAVADLAAPENVLMNAYVRLDGRLLAKPDRAITLIDTLYLMFLKGEIASAIRKASRKNKTELVRNIMQVIGTALGKVGSFVADRDLSVSILQGRFELKKSQQ
jgi:hypothetical protein